MGARVHFIKYLLIVSISLLFLSACGPAEKAETVMPQTKPSCGAETLEHQFIVKYKTGEIHVVHGDRTYVRDHIVAPQVEDILAVEYDQVLPAIKISELQTNSTPFIDNWALRRLGASFAWEKGFRGDGITVAVIDSGVDINHPLLENQIAFNSGELGQDSLGSDKRFNEIDDDGNGYIDDYAGYDFYTSSSVMTDQLNHGTHVAGIIAAEHNESEVNDSMILGLSPGVKILPVRFIGEDGGTISDAILSLDYAKMAGAQIINASWGGRACSSFLNQKIRELNAEGILVVAAAGNSGSNLDFFPEYPAAFQNPLQITVGATGRLDGKTSFSNYSRNFVHIFAPGFDIPSTLPEESYGSLSGTSMATPFVAAAAAILMSAEPSLSASEARELIFNTGAKSSNYVNTTQGRLDLGAALEALGL